MMKCDTGLVAILYQYRVTPLIVILTCLREWNMTPRIMVITPTTTKFEYTWGHFACFIIETLTMFDYKVAKFIRDRDRGEIRINVHKNLQTTPTFVVATPTLGRLCTATSTKHIKIYGLKFDNILSLCLCHTSICAIELDSGTMLQNQANWDTTGT